MVGACCGSADPDRVRASRAGLLAVALVAVFGLAGCKSGSPETTGSIGGLSLGRKPAEEQRISRAEVDALGAKYRSDPNDARLAMRYARALRATDQKPQAVAVLQQTALHNPKDLAVLAAYGKSLADAGRYQEASEVLQNAHSPAKPDWRILSAQGTVADQTGDAARAQGFYEAALKIAPNEPTVLSNLGLSYALSRRLDEAEATLRLAAEQPGADARVRQNLALVLGLKGRFDEAETLMRQDMSELETAANMASLRAMAAQPNARAARTAKTGPALPRG